MKMIRVLQKIRYLILSYLYRSRIVFEVNKADQIRLMRMYKEMLYPVNLKDIGFQNYSGSDEDGIILYLISILGIKNWKIIDIGAGTPLGSNSANLIVHHGWEALLIDSSKFAKELSLNFYKKIPQTNVNPPKFETCKATSKNINEIIKNNGFKGEIDVLSIDIDSIDYWIWESITVVDPRIVIVEYQTALGPSSSLTVPNRDDFDRFDYEINNADVVYGGASLPALVKLGQRKGYSFVGTNAKEFNAFFVRADLKPEYLQEKKVSECFITNRSFRLVENYGEILKEFDWEKV